MSIATVVDEGYWTALEEQTRALSAQDFLYPSHVTLGDVLGSGRRPHATSPLRYQTAMRHFLKHVKKPGGISRFFDFGCGIATMVMWAAHEGWQSYGVDINEDVIESANYRIEQAYDAEFITTGAAQVAHGDAFPRDFEVAFGSADDRFRRYIDQHREGSQPVHFEDVFGCGLHDMDVWYHYQVELKTNMFRLFSKVAKPGAYLALVSVSDDNPDLPLGMVPVARYEQLTLYQER